MLVLNVREGKSLIIYDCNKIICELFVLEAKNHKAKLSLSLDDSTICDRIKVFERKSNNNEVIKERLECFRKSHGKP